MRRVIAARIVSNSSNAVWLSIVGLRALRVLSAVSSAQLSRTQHLSSALRRSFSVVLHRDSVRQRVDVSMFVTGRALESMRVSPNAAEGEDKERALMGPPAASSPAATKGADDGLGAIRTSDSRTTHNKEKARG